MEAIKRMLILCLFGIQPLDGQCQQFEIIGSDVTTVSHALSHAAILNDSTTIAVGGYGWGTGSIIKSTDYGQSWVKTEVAHALFQVTFVNESVGYAVGEGATVMKTIDGGESWIYQNTSIISPAFQNRTVAFADESVGFVGPTNGPGFAFLYTYDGGETWQNAEAGSVYGRAKIQVVDDSTVYSLGYGFGAPLYISSNLGMSWEEIALPENTGAPRDMHFFDRDTGIVVIREFDANCGSNFYVVNTEDGGNSWSSQYFSCTFFSSLTFPTRDVGYALGSISSNGTRFMWRTLDGGENWEEFEYLVDDEHTSVGGMALSIACVDADTCYMPANYARIIKMTNATGGALNAPQQPRESAKLKIFPNPNNGQFVLDSELQVSGPIQLSIYSIDGRQVFQKQIMHGRQTQIDTPNLPSGIYMLSIDLDDSRHFTKFIKM